MTMIRFRYLCLILVVAALAGCNKTKTGFWQGKVFDAPAEIAYRNVALDQLYWIPSIARTKAFPESSKTGISIILTNISVICMNFLRKDG